MDLRVKHEDDSEGMDSRIKSENDSEEVELPRSPFLVMPCLSGIARGLFQNGLDTAHTGR